MERGAGGRETENRTIIELNIAGCRTLANRWYVLLRWNPCAVLEADRCVSSGVYCLFFKETLNQMQADMHQPSHNQDSRKEYSQSVGPCEEGKKKQRRLPLDDTTCLKV